MRLAELVEKVLTGSRAPLYHWTPTISLESILRWDALGEHDYDPTRGVTAIKKGWLSVSRSQQYRKGRIDETARLVLDGSLVRRDFKVRPVVDWWVAPAHDRDGTMTRHESRWEAEERVYGPIQPLDDYLLKIQISEKAHNELVNLRANYVKYQKEGEHDKKMFSKGYFRMGDHHKTHPGQYLRFEDIPVEPEKLKKMLARAKKSYSKPDTYYQDLIAGVDRILDDPKLQTGFTQT